jgi:hypothetical protein
MARDKNSTRVNSVGNTVVSLFQDQPSAEAAIQRLTAAGFLEQQIGVAVRDRQQQQEIAEGTGTKAAEGAKTGAVGGGVVGGAVGLLASVGALAIPGIGPIIAGGALASTLAGAGIGAAAGGLIGALVGMGIPEEDARHFEQGFQRGGILVTVEAGERSSEARQLLSDSGADLGPAGRAFAPSAGTISDSVHPEETGIDSEDDVDVGSYPYEGSERRLERPLAYAGPERRLAAQR